MALIFVDGFDHYDDASLKWDSINSGGALIDPTQSEGRFTPGALRVQESGGGGSITKNLPQLSEVIVGFAMLPDNSEVSQVELGTTSSTSADVKLTMSPSTGIISLRLPENGTIYDSAPSLITTATWHFIELRYKLGETDGEVEVRHNGAVVITQTGIDTRWAATAPSATIEELTVAAPGNGNIWYMDDLHVMDTTGTRNNAFIGDSRITTLHPDAAGVNSDFTPTGAESSWQATNELLIDQDATYAEGGAVGARDSHQNESFDDKGVVPGTIYGVQVSNCNKKTDAGELRYSNEINVGSQVFSATERTANATLYKVTTDIWETDPRDSTDWSEAKLAVTGSGYSVTFREV